MTVSQYFTKVKSLWDEIQKIDAESAINEARMRRIIIRGLDPKYSGLVISTGGLATQSFFKELESILANQEDLNVEGLNEGWRKNSLHKKESTSWPR